MKHKFPTTFIFSVSNFLIQQPHFFYFFLSMRGRSWLLPEGSSSRGWNNLKAEASCLALPVLYWLSLSLILWIISRQWLIVLLIVVCLVISCCAWLGRKGNSESNRNSVLINGDVNLLYAYEFSIQMIISSSLVWF